MVIPWVVGGSIFPPQLIITEYGDHGYGLMSPGYNALSRFDRLIR